MEGEKVTTWRGYYVTLIILAINVIGYILCIKNGELIYDIGSMNADKIIRDAQYYRFLICMFLHADIEHIVSNMIFLVGLGQMVETAVGHLRFLVLYMLSGIGAGVLSFLYCILTGIVYDAVGASGAIFGLIGGLLIIVISHHGKYGSVSAGRLAFAIIYMIYSGARNERIDNAAHVGGLFCGVIIMAVMSVISTSKTAKTLS